MLVILDDDRLWSVGLGTECARPLGIEPGIAASERAIGRDDAVAASEPSVESTAELSDDES